MTQNQNVQNKDVKNEFTQQEYSVWSIGEADKEGNIGIRMETKQFEAKIKIGLLGDYTFDSRKNDNEKGSALGQALTPLYERLSGANIGLTISPQGKVMKLEGYKELLGDLLKDNPIAAQFAAGGSEEVAKMGFSEFIIQFEKKAVTPGTRWETPFEMNLDKFGTAKGKKTYIYEGEDKVGSLKTARITVATELSFDLDSEMGGAKVTGRMSVTESKGQLQFDPKRGVLVSLNNQYKISGNLNVSAGGMEIPIQIEQVQHITVDLMDQLPK
jgi:hypothetical protein